MADKKMGNMKSGEEPSSRSRPLCAALLLVIAFAFLFTACEGFSPPYNVTFDSNGGSFPSNGGSPVFNSFVNNGDKVDRPEDPVLARYIFSGWFTDNGTYRKPYRFTSPVYNDMTLYAKWVQDNSPSIISVVTFYNDYDDDPDNITQRLVYFNTSVQRPEDPIKAGFYFTGWYTEAPPVYGDLYNFNNKVTVHYLDLYAKWEPAPPPHNVSFDPNYVGSTVAVQAVNDGGTASEPYPAPTRTGYYFSGWYTDDPPSGELYDFNTPVTTSFTLYARWGDIPDTPLYLVEFDTNGGTGVDPQVINSDSVNNKVVKPVPDPEKIGHSFLGWYRDNGTFYNLYDFSTPVTGGFTLYAKWDEMPTAAVTFYYNGGSNSSETMTGVNLDEVVKNVYIGQPIPQPDNSAISRPYGTLDPPHGGGDPRRTHYVFRGWYTDNKSFLKKADFSALVTGTQDIKLYAKWIPDYMAKIPEGDFLMGSSVTDLGALMSESPKHAVMISNYYLSKFQVTRELYEFVMGHPMFNAKLDPRPSQDLPDSPLLNLPVETISWYEALVFCNRLSILEGLAPVYTISNTTNPDNWGSTNKGQIPVNTSTVWDRVTVDPDACGYRMPTEAEWEYACRAGTTLAYNLPIPSGSNSANDIQGWYKSNCTNVQVVGLKDPNVWDLYDMHGNVWEWCWDWFNEKDYYETSPFQDPPGPASSGTSGGTRVLRGGCFNSDALAVRSANRFRHIPPYKININGISDFQGLRIACMSDF